MQTSLLFRLASYSSLILAAQWISTPGAFANQDAELAKEIEAALRDFHRDPVAAMNQRVPKRDASGAVIPAIESRFSIEQIASGDYVVARDRTRKRMCMNVNGELHCLDAREGEEGRPLSGIWGEDRVENLVDVPVRANTLEELETLGIQAAELSEQPWSDDYWAFYQGILGVRYADPFFPASENWAVNRNYVLRNSVNSILNWGDQARIDELAPSEKYDLLVGDVNGALTAGMWQLGANYYYNRGFVETWMGICEGWSAASFMYPRPSKVVSVLAANGRTRLNFYPSDIKALGSLLWAYGKQSLRFVGGRCEESKPATDANGRVVSQRCFDTNPGTWHLAITHQLGIAKRSMVMDATYDYEVWNQPLFSYSYTYFNPQTGLNEENLKDAIIPLRSYTRDPFRYYRSSSARSVVGIAMTVKYMVEVPPSHRKTDNPTRDRLRKVRYFYDLELDSSGGIIGGEWYSNRHPDFLWVPVPGSRSRSNYDHLATGRWRSGDTLPWSWQNAARQASQYQQPLGPIVDALMAR
ncbi:MAG: hypothetical protein A2X94_01690 [Bdellovibrionales bacterium GWB1_55_8]|nr:MAG: hypothetical protein A2X94_01690 [Bdellovibrionales bacterium GWB1_55_8]